MLTVNEISNIKQLSHFRLVAGEEGLKRLVSSVVIFEYESFKMQLSSYYEGCFIVSTLIFAKDQPDLLVPTLKTLIRQGITGMAIKAVYFNQLPEEIIQLANQKKLPVFLFDNTYMEDVIVSIHDYIKSKQHFNLFEKEIHHLLSFGCSAIESEAYCSKMNPIAKKYGAGCFLLPKKRTDEHLIKDLLNSLSLRRNQKLLEPSYRFFQYQDGLFILYNTKEEERSQIEIDGVFQFLFERLDCSKQAFYIGISSLHTLTTELDVCFKECFFSALYCKRKALDKAHFSCLGAYSMLFPLLQDKLSMLYYREKYQQLISYDEKNNTLLVQTLFSFLENNFDLKKTAAALYQHPNTIRYRVEKSKELLCSPSDSFLLSLFPMLLILWDLDAFFTADSSIDWFRP